eukprot:g9126.t1
MDESTAPQPGGLVTRQSVSLLELRCFRRWNQQLRTTGIRGSCGGDYTRLALASAGAAALAGSVGARKGKRDMGRARQRLQSTKTSVLETKTEGIVDGIGANPATSWPAGKPAHCEEMVGELPGLYELPPKEASWVERSLEYNTQGGKMNRGLIVVETGVMLLKHQGREVTNADLHRFAVLGWAVEYLQACMLMADDMMDGSVTRRGNPCWYRLPEVGLLNTNDFLMVEMYVYKIVKRHFGKEQIFPWLIDLLLETTFQTECGQLLDSICANCDLEELTTERWTLIVTLGTAFYSFYLPVALAMLVTGVRDHKAFDTAREALLLMGIYFQAQDDYLDAFASPEVLGKVGTDIQD